MKIGTIITNGINYWMVWDKDNKYVVPVILNKEKTEIEQICFSWRNEFWCRKKVGDIKPYVNIVDGIKLIKIISLPPATSSL